MPPSNLEKTFERKLKTTLLDSYAQGLQRLREERPQFSESRTLQMFEASADKVVAFLLSNFADSLRRRHGVGGREDQEKLRRLFWVALNDLCVKYRWKVVQTALRLIAEELSSAAYENIGKLYEDHPEFREVEPPEQHEETPSKEQKKAKGEKPKVRSASDVLRGLKADQQARKEAEKAGGDEESARPTQSHDSADRAANFSHETADLVSEMVAVSYRELDDDTVAFLQKIAPSAADLKALTPDMREPGYPIFPSLRLYRPNDRTPARTEVLQDDVNSQITVEGLNQLLTKENLVFLEGDNGSGRTTLLQALAWFYLERINETRDDPRFPVFLSLGALYHPKSPLGRNLGDFFSRRAHPLPMPPDLQKRPIMLLIDDLHRVLREHGDVFGDLAKELRDLQQTWNVKVAISAPPIPDYQYQQMQETFGKLMVCRLGTIKPEHSAKWLAEQDAPEDLRNAMQRCFTSFSSLVGYPSAYASFLKLLEREPIIRDESADGLIGAYTDEALDFMVGALPDHRKIPTEEYREHLATLALELAIQRSDSLDLGFLTHVLPESFVNLLQRAPTQAPSILHVGMGEVKFSHSGFQRYFLGIGLFRKLRPFIDNDWEGETEDEAESHDGLMDLRLLLGRIPLREETMRMLTSQTVEHVRSWSRGQRESLLQRLGAVMREEALIIGESAEADSRIVPIVDEVSLPLRALCLVLIAGISRAFSQAMTMSSQVHSIMRLLARLRSGADSVSVLAPVVLGQMTGTRWESAEIKNADLRALDLSEAWCVDATFSGCGLTDTKWHKADMARATIAESRLDRAHFSEIKGREFTVRDSSLIGVTIEKTPSRGMLLERSMIDEMKLHKVTGRETAIHRCQGEAVEISNIEWEVCDLQRVDLWTSNIVHGRFISGTIKHSRFFRSIFEECTFSAIDLTGTSFRGSVFHNCTFRGCKLVDVDFRGCTFEKSRIESCEGKGCLITSTCGLPTATLDALFATGAYLIKRSNKSGETPGHQSHAKSSPSIEIELPKRLRDKLKEHSKKSASSKSDGS